MLTLLLCICLGCMLGILDIIPMIKNKIDKYAITSAFSYHVIMPYLLLNITNENTSIYIGGVLYFICSIPIVILVSKTDKKAVPIILLTSFIIGIICNILINLFIR